MVRHSPTTNPAHEHRVRELAYHLWEAEGKPHGRDVEYWERARELVGKEATAEQSQSPEAATQPHSGETESAKPAKSAKPAENAEKPARKSEAKATSKRKSRAPGAKQPKS